MELSSDRLLAAYTDAQTYVTRGDTESPEAMRLAQCAVQICRERIPGNAPLLGEALHHYGISCASCAQVLGLMCMDPSTAALVPNPPFSV